MFLADGGEVFGGVEIDTMVASGDAPEVAVGIGVADDPGIGSAADGVNKVIFGKGSGFFKNGIGAIDGHLGVPGAEGFVEAGDEVGVFFGEVARFAGVNRELVELGV